MTALSLPFEVFVDGDPAPKGSVSVNRGRRGVRHTQRSKDWQAVIVDAIVRKRAGMLLAGTLPQLPDPLAVEVAVHAQFVIRRPKRNADEAPTTMWVGDLDKHVRSLLDALTASKVIEDDSLVTELHVTKRWAGDVERCGVRILVAEPSGALARRALLELAQRRAEEFDAGGLEWLPAESTPSLTAEKLHAAIDSLRPSKYLGEAPTAGMLRSMEAETNARRDAFSPHDPMAGIDGRYPARRRADLGVPFGESNEFGERG